VEFTRQSSEALADIQLIDEMLCAETWPIHERNFNPFERAVLAQTFDCADLNANLPIV
jgi:hypothetical protein